MFLTPASEAKLGYWRCASMDFVRDQRQLVWTALKAPMGFGWRIWKTSGLDFLDSKAGQF